MGVAVSSSHIGCATPSSSGEGLLTLFPSSNVRSLSWEAVLHKILQHKSFPWTAVLYKLLQCGSLPWGAVLQEPAAPVWVPHRVTSPASKLALAWAPLSMGPQVPAGACSSTGSPQGHSLLRASTCSGLGSSTGFRCQSAPPWTSMD